MAEQRPPKSFLLQNQEHCQKWPESTFSDLLILTKGLEGYDFQNRHILLFKISSFQQNITEQVKK